MLSGSQNNIYMKVTQALHLQARHTSSHRHTYAKRIVQAVHLQAGHMPTQIHRHTPTQTQTKLYNVCICRPHRQMTKRRRARAGGGGGRPTLDAVGCPICGLSILWVIQFVGCPILVGCPVMVGCSSFFRGEILKGRDEILSAPCKHHKIC